MISLFHVCLLFTRLWEVCLLKALCLSCSTDLQLALVEVDDVRVAVREQTLCTPLTTDTTFLVAGEDAMNVVSMLFEKVNGKMTYA